MTDKICELVRTEVEIAPAVTDEETGEVIVPAVIEIRQVQRERDATPEEQAEIDERRAAALIPVVPVRVDRLQARLALIHAGKWDLIQPAIDAISDPTERAVAQAYFEDAKYWYRNDAFVLMLGPSIGLSNADMDALFIAAAEY